MGSIVSKLADEIALHGSYEAYADWRDRQRDDIQYFPDPEVVNRPEIGFDNGFVIDGFVFDEVPDAGFRERVLPAWYISPDNTLIPKFKE